MAACSAPVTEEAVPPNIILIFADDLGYGDLGSFGHPTIQTPNLDQMAMEGQKWTQFYVAAPLCTPSRAALLTGRYPIRSGVIDVLFPYDSTGLPTSEVTIAELLKQKDYATTTIGKWHLGHLPAFLPMQHGFDSYYGIPYSNDMDPVKEGKEGWVNDPRFSWDYEQFNVPLMENEQIVERPAYQPTITTRYTERSVDFIKANKDRPFFLYLAHSLPHIPLFVHPDREGKSKQGLYGDVIEEIDWSVGQILGTLQELELDQNTLVVFTSDNGPWLSFKTHAGSAGPLRAGKGTTFEGGQRVPTIFWGPGLVEAGIVREVGSTLDLLPTFSALAGTDLPKEVPLDGYDLSPLLKGEGADGPRTHFFYWHMDELFAVRSGKWKLHFRQSRSETDWDDVITLDEPELYDLEADVSEKYDVAEFYPEVVEQLQQIAAEHLSLLSQK